MLCPLSLSARSYEQRVKGCGEVRRETEIQSVCTHEGRILKVGICQGFIWDLSDRVCKKSPLQNG